MSQKPIKILWVDDEIELLKPHILFLTKKGYEMVPVNSGTDAIDLFKEQSFDIIFLDENMPGMSGLETLALLKAINPTIPVVMITKSEEEYIMEEAIGSKITDYLIKPLNPNQIWLSVKKIIDNKRLVAQKTNQSYQQDFQNLSMAFNDDLDFDDWVDIYNKLVYWELEIKSIQSQDMAEVLEMQKAEANVNFIKFIKENYVDWLNNSTLPKPLMSHQLLKKKLFPMLKNPDDKVFFILIDNLRLDQWKALEPILLEYFNIEEDICYYSILPTTTAYARNSIFAGMLPADMAKFHSDIWVQEDDEEGKNLNEAVFLERQLKSNGLQSVKFEYNKIITQAHGKALLEQFPRLLQSQLNVMVYNFVDMLSHARTDVEMIKELMPDEAAYRRLTQTWFLHSPLFEMLKKIAGQKAKLVITTDHGTILVKKPVRIIGDKDVNTNLRYKQGKNLNYSSNKLFSTRKPELFHLPKINVSTSYVFATEDYFFVYPNNHNYYVNYYKNTFQHGGISLEEVIIPFVSMTTK